MVERAVQLAPVARMRPHLLVVLAGLEEGLFPHSRSAQDEEELEEERRLCYVGMTRAEKKLFLTWARYRRRFGGGQPEASIKSRFLDEVPTKLIEDRSPRRSSSGRASACPLGYRVGRRESPPCRQGQTPK